MAADARQREHVATTSMRVIRDRVGATLTDAARTTAADLYEAAPQSRAAVAIVLREVTEQPQVLLIRRAQRAGDPWSGHMAFPGGREEPCDESLLATALRETREELALNLADSGTLLGRLGDLPAIARGRRIGMVIAPFVFELTGDPELTYDPYEVAEAVWAPLDPLLRGARRTTFAAEREGQPVHLPAHDVDGRIVWGLTYRMLENLFALLR